MKPLIACWLAVGFVGGALAAPVTVTVGSPTAKSAIPSDFVGLSFETSNLNPERDGSYIFSAQNRELITLFRSIGIKNLRVGGGTAEPKSLNAADNAKYPVPGPKDIDQLFAFAEAADVRVIYTLRLLKGDRQQTVDLAKYIWTHYRSRLDSFSIGNEPDWHAYHSYPGRTMDPRIYETVPGIPGSAYGSYLSQWRDFAAGIRRAVPGAMFSGPDTGSDYPVTGAKETGVDGKSWTEKFADDEKGSGLLAAVLAHDYVGQSAKDVPVPAAIDAMLSRTWLIKEYPAFYNQVVAPVQADGFLYRMTECNDYTGGVKGASDAFASALWALDYMHWQAAHGVIGVNFHNKRWIFTDTIYRDPAGEYHLNPKAYGLKAFSLGSQGRVAPVTIANPNGLNLTAYAVAEGANWCVTLINKEHGPTSREGEVTLALPTPARAATMVALTAPGGDPQARTGITLGGGEISGPDDWRGVWSALPNTDRGQFHVIVPATSAVVIRLTTP